MSTNRFLIALSDGHQQIFDAIVLEIWNTQNRPKYCAILFGFEMTHELNEEIVVLQESPPLQDDFEIKRHLKQESPPL